ncbi:MAG: signal peptidase II [Pseudomonadales bacterium]|jgi:signal peptidase II|nr:signal peptidase II [Pseudomonadales bacterium]
MFKWVAVAVTIWIADQATKYVVVSNMLHRDEITVWPFFSLVRWHNEGAAFSFLADAGGWQHWFFVGLASAFSVYLLFELYRLKKEEQILGWVFAFILGGALGNLTDRLNHGYVVDFLFFHWQEHGFPAFNVADSALFCGAAFWILLMILDYRRAKTT